MAINVTQNVEQLKVKAKTKMVHATDPLEYVQAVFLARGASGFKGAQRRFRLMDKDGNKTLSYEEFAIGMREAGVDLKPDGMYALFAIFDRDKKGTIDYEEFIYAAQPKMNENRKKLVKKVFMALDKTGDMKITIKDLMNDYMVHKHPKYISGEWTEVKVLKEFLKTFEAEDHLDGEVTYQEFESYYSCISANIDKDSYFDLMMKSTWRKLFRES